MTIPDDIIHQSAMLACPSNTIAPTPEAALNSLSDRGRHSYEIKWDGIRCLAYADNGVITLRNRNGVDISYRYPEVVDQLAKIYPTGTRVFDAEMLSFDANGQPLFSRIHRRDAQSSATKAAQLAKTLPATLMVFDLLFFEGDDLRALPLTARRAILNTESKRFGNDPRVMVTSWSDDGATLWDFICTHNMEGLIAKDKLSQYRGRRDSAWIKLKRVHRISALVTGYDEGKGARAGKVGALHLALCAPDGTLVPIGRVGTGLKERDHKPLLATLATGEPFIVEIEFAEVTKDGQLRFPVYFGIRTDVTGNACTVAQLAQLS